MSGLGESETNGTGEPIQNDGPVEEVVSPPDDTLGSAFLKNIPEVDRRVLEPYVKQWDQGVNKRFQEIHAQYRPYKELGADPEDLRNAMAIWQMLDEEAGQRQLLTNLAGHLGIDLEAAIQALAAQQQDQQSAQMDQQVSDPRYQGLSSEFLEEYGQMRQLMQAVGQFLVNQQQQTSAQQQDQELKTYLSELHKKHGDFDEEWVLMKMSQGMDGEKAVGAFKSFVQNIVNTAGGNSRLQPPPILGGQGAVPSSQVDPSKFSPGESKTTFAKMLELAKQASQ